MDHFIAVTVEGDALAASGRITEALARLSTALSVLERSAQTTGIPYANTLCRLATYREIR